MKTEPETRRDISKLLARYALEPSIRDVYVEGATDEKIFRTFLTAAKLDTVNVRRIDVLNVPDDLLSKYSLTRGEKSEVIAAAREVFALFGDTRCFTGIVDLDSDQLLSSVEDSPLLLVTDLTCSEMYWLTEETVRKFTTFLSNDSLDVKALMDRIDHPVRELFLIRAAARRLGLPLTFRPFVGYLNVSGGLLELAQNKYLDMLLNTCRLHKEKLSLQAEMERLRPALSADLRMAGQGHDLFSAINFAFKRDFIGAGIREDKGITTLVWMALDVATLFSFPLFESLVARLTT